MHPAPAVLVPLGLAHVVVIPTAAAKVNDIHPAIVERIDVVRSIRIVAVVVAIVVPWWRIGRIICGVIGGIVGRIIRRIAEADPNANGRVPARKHAQRKKEKQQSYD